MKTIDFTSGVNPFGPSNKARNAIRSNVRQISVISPKSLARLKSYIAKKEGIREDCILFGTGTTAILNRLLEHINPRKILIPHPASQRHCAILSKYSPEYSLVPLKGDEGYDLNINEFCNSLHGCEAAILPNPHDVTGTIISPEDITRIVDEADRLGVYLVIDEAYVEYTGVPSLAVRISHSSRALTLRTFSTFHALGGLRLGYIIGPPNLVELIESKIDPSWINSFAPWAALASVKDKSYRRRSLLFIEGEKAYISEKLSQIKNVKCFVSPSNMLIIRLLKEYESFQKLFERHKVLIDTFSDEHGNTCIRFPVQNRRMNARFVRILKKLMEV